MKHIETEILVIGGGATGTGIAWDAALRGFRVVLVEKRDLTHGTTGRYHGLLHSGGRYVVKDPHSAAECIAENRILRKTHAHCIEDTGGFFVVTSEDENDYPDQFQAACGKIGIPCEEISVAAALKREPLMNPDARRVFVVPDGAADSFQATHSTAQAARQAGAQILNYHEVVQLLVEGGDGDRRVVGAHVRDVARGEDVEIRARMTINAAGAWSGVVARTAGVRVDVIPGKGTMLAVNHRIINTVLNRCKMPDDGDIIVPIHTVSVLGTTDERVEDPEHLTIEPWEVELLLREGEKLIPGVSRTRFVRAWAGVRPLYQEHYNGASRDATRDLTLLDHQSRDGVAGFLTILGGKWTTFRLMAQVTMDKACEYLGTCKPCVTAQTVVPGVEQGHYWLGHRLREVEEHHLQSDLVCECELVTRAMLENAARNNPTLTLDDLRRDVRLGMGPCQGGFCTYRAAGILHELQIANGELRSSDEWNVAYMQSPSHNQQSAIGSQQSAVGGRNSQSQRDAPQFANSNLLLRDFLQERWKGLLPILWGRQLKQERLDELIYLALMNADHLPDENITSPMSEFYARPGMSATADKGGAQ
ncbi:MAG: anaerobic glycerol-3-phosphate dehydrogenase subunit A [Anaerolineales bacterium]|nr:anaerobic glycerol-3-phosphate dehydrogenase subunit A [Anaerolineales bacterium]